MTREEAIHIVDIAFDVPVAIRKADENRTYHEEEIRKAKEMAIKALEQEPKTGHWIRMKAYEKWGCSECSTVFRFTFKEHDYCPNCGAKMVNPQERSGKE